MYCPFCRTELTVKKVKERDVQSCSACGYLNWENPIPVATGLLLKGDKVVLVKSRTRGNRWCFPSGFIEENEKAEDALIREVKEETNLNVSIINALGTYPIDTGRKKILLIAYEAIIKDGEFSSSSEISEIDEFTPDVALNMLDGKEERSILENWKKRNYLK
jgi:NADH pyrophosphatase NudC (nudix superfamily)